MKKNGILLLCFLLFIGLIIFVQLALKSDVEWVSKKTQEIENSFDNHEQAIQIYSELNEHWEKREVLWGMLLPHDNLQDINKEIKKLGVALKNHKKENIEEAIVSVNLTLLNLLQRNTLRLDHIF